MQAGFGRLDQAWPARLDKRDASSARELARRLGVTPRIGNIQSLTDPSSPAIFRDKLQDGFRAETNNFSELSEQGLELQR